MSQITPLPWITIHGHFKTYKYFLFFSNLLKAVVLVSEKAANIARAIRQEEHLLSLLIQEKKDNEKNPRFAHDFKTLADVLVQEVVKHDLGKEVLFTCQGVCVRLFVYEAQG